MGAPWLGRNDTDTCLGVRGPLGAESGQTQTQVVPEAWGLVIRGVRPRGEQVACQGSGLLLGSLAGWPQGGAGDVPSRDKLQEKGRHRIP